VTRIRRLYADDADYADSGLVINLRHPVSHLLIKKWHDGEEKHTHHCQDTYNCPESFEFFVSVHKLDN